MISQAGKIILHLHAVAALALIGFACYNAYFIRLYAVKDYGRVIHEFDPWFNFRATQYLADNGWDAFFSWFDHRSWYPLGRPVGTTIYPGMQIISVWLWQAINAAGVEMSLNDVCVFVPAWFGVSATIITGLIAKECSGSWSAAAVTSVIMAIIPAHIMRSVAGGFDNESVAMTTMTLTFYLWVRSLRTKTANNTFSPEGRVLDELPPESAAPTLDSYIFGTLCGLAYIAMVAAWGGFIFVLNLIGAHAGLLFLLGQYNSSLHRAYSLFYIIGTIGATHVPVVGWTPLKSLEQLGPFVVFFGFQLLEVIERKRQANNLSVVDVAKLRVKYGAVAIVVGGLVASSLFQQGFFSPLSARVRALFVKHTRTGNPLVDSVAEHQPASESSYRQYLNVVYPLAQAGLILCIANVLITFLLPHVNASPLKGFSLFAKRRHRYAASFVVVYGVIAFFFANKMSRLILLLGPVSSILGGIVIGSLMDQLIVLPLFHGVNNLAAGEAAKPASVKQPNSKKKKGGKTKKNPVSKKQGSMLESLSSIFFKPYQMFYEVFNSQTILVLRLSIGAYLVMFVLISQYTAFHSYSDMMAKRMSHPSIMFKATLSNGQNIIVDDYREAYWWLRDSTPEDSRVLSWWDYGYQISGIGNRTTLADGNTWNHEHIATIGRILTAPEAEAHKLARHLADYVLLWTGGGGDDLAKSPHMARIGNSVYPGLCPNDPTCAHFGFYSREPLRPTPSMENSLLYKLSVQGLDPKVQIDPKLFTLAYESKYKKVRIYKIQRVSQKSKKWVANFDNKLCASPGSWYCPGQYPPAIQDFISTRKDFKQVEDFNVEKDEEAQKYQDQYMKKMDRHKAKADKPVINVKYKGCYSSEAAFETGKNYVGGTTGASIEEAYQYGFANSYKYAAIARTDADGHSFFMQKKPNREFKVADSECANPCVDNKDALCGCSGAACGNLQPGSGDSNLRRWAVYILASGKN